MFVVAETNERGEKCLYIYDCVADRSLDLHIPSLRMIGSFVDDYCDINRMTKQGRN